MPGHDHYGDDAADRIQRSEWRNPRVVNIDITGKIRGWGELSNKGTLEDTTLNWRVLERIEAVLNASDTINCGYVRVDGIEYVFIVNRIEK